MRQKSFYSRRGRKINLTICCIERIGAGAETASENGDGITEKIVQSEQWIYWGFRQFQW